MAPARREKLISRWHTMHGAVHGIALWRVGLAAGSDLRTHQDVLWALHLGRTFTWRSLGVVFALADVQVVEGADATGVGHERSFRNRISRFVRADPAQKTGAVTSIYRDAVTERRRRGGIDIVTLEEFLSAELAGLSRFAGALTGDPHLAEDILSDALLVVVSRWRRISATECVVAKGVPVR